MIRAALFGLAIAVLLVATFSGPTPLPPFADVRPLGWTCGGILLAIALAMVVSAFRTRGLTHTAFRLDVFLPFLRRRRDSAPFGLPAWLLGVARLTLPKTFLADPATGKPGRFRRLLKRVGPTWYSSPFRRVIQTIFFLAFLWLFFYVCWPYSAQPASPGKVWTSWRPLEAENGKLIVAKSGESSPDIRPGMIVHAADEAATVPEQQYLGAFRVVVAGVTKLQIQSLKDLAPEELQLLPELSPGPWTLRQDGASRSKLVRGWSPTFDAASGQLILGASQPASTPFLDAGTVVDVLDEALEDPEEQKLGSFRIARVLESRLGLEPATSLPAEEVQQLLAISSGTWSLCERDPTAWPSHYANDLKAKEWVAAETFLIIDPLVSISTAIAAKAWVWSLVFAGVILLIGVLVPRGFCGYICPLGTLIDLFDWAIGKRVTRFRVGGEGWWVHIKYYLLLGTLIAAMCGVLISGFVSAIPVITRGLMYTFGPLQTGLSRGWHNVPPLGIGHFISIALFFVVLGLGLLRPRFWCKYVCPSGAVFSVGNLLRASERKVESTCIHCNKCVEICPFDAIKPDFTTRTTDCTLCQTCGGVCPTHAIKFVERWNTVELKVEDDPPTGETAIGRRGFLAAGIGTAAATIGGLAAAGGTKALGADLDDPDAFRPVRPPGSVPEQEFLQMCIRCGECFKACPNDVLQVLGFQQGLEGLWSPHVVADWAGCESSCNACGQVCPTGAIRVLPLEEKKVARMGLAIVNETTCLPYAGREACQLCVDECDAAGYHAIEFMQVHTEVDEQTGVPVEGSGFAAPRVLPDRCVGCGLCQTRCYGINVAEKQLLDESAIIIEAGEGKEDRMMNGSYVQLRQEEARQRAEQQRRLDEERHKRLRNGGGDGSLPAWLK